MEKIKLFEEFVNEAHLPSNIADWLKHQETDIRNAAKKVAGWAEKCDAHISGGTSIGKSPQTLILDIKYQGSEIYINPDGDIEFLGDDVNTLDEFKAKFNEYKSSTPELRKYFKVEEPEKVEPERAD